MDEYYSTIAASYDELHGEEQERKLGEFLAHVSLPHGARLLDVGCATGRSALLLPHVVWQGIEPSSGLIAHASSDVQSSIVQGAAESLPFPDESFDVVLSLTVLQNVDDLSRSLSEMSRVCVRDGILLLSFLKRSSKAPIIDARIHEQFVVVEHWEQEKDLMYVCTKKSE